MLKALKKRVDTIRAVELVNLSARPSEYLIVDLAESCVGI